jgi:hypothetical protein
MAAYTALSPILPCELRLCPRLLLCRSLIAPITPVISTQHLCYADQASSLPTLHHNCFPVVMVVCTGCMVESQESRCGHDERYCHNCCTTKININTCLTHFKALGNPAQTARFASGKVMAQVTEFMAAKANGTPPPPPPAPSPALSSSSSLPVPSPAVAPGPDPLVAAMRAEFQVERAAMQAQIDAQAAAMRQVLATVAKLQAQSSAPAAASPAAVLPVVQRSSPAVPPPHHQSVLGASSIEHEALLDQILRDPGANEVRHSSHNAPPASPRASSSAGSWPNPLPESLIPAMPGSERDNTQILTSIITGLKAREVKYTTLAQLDTALGDWWELAVTGNTWTSKQLNSLMLYRRFVIDTLGKRSPFHSVVKYHTLWIKAVNTRKHDMFADDGHIYLSALIEAEIQLGPATSSSSNKGKKTPSTSEGKERKEGETPKKSFPAGSCTHHPESTTHTTVQCKNPK